MVQARSSSIFVNNHTLTHDDGDDGENETVIGEQSVKTKTRDEQV